MKNRFMIILLNCFALMLCSGLMVKAQDGCKVLMPSISGTYTGKCKKGLAHGKGKAVGVDTYEGRFSKGLPDGSGIYTWADGRVYDGSWAEGVREGKGTLIFPRVGEDSVVTGIWKDNMYFGPVPKPPYKVIRTMSVPRYSIRKINDMGSSVRIGLFLGGNYNSGITDFSLMSDTGEQVRVGQRFGIDNGHVPYTISVKYRTWNHLRTQQHNVIFEFTINEPGTFEVNIHN